MKYLVICGILCCASAAALADGAIAPVNCYGFLNYEQSLGLITPLDELRSAPRVLWSVTASTGQGYFFPQQHCVVDWGDLSNAVPIGTLGFSAFTNSQATDGHNKLFLCFYGSENGWNSTQRQLLSMYVIDNLPGSTHNPAEYGGYLWRLLLENPLTLAGNDLDGDGLIDFGYSLGFRLRTPGAMAGPLIAAPTYPDEPQFATGIEDAFDYFAGVTPQVYIGTYNFDGDPFAQFYFELLSPKCSDDPEECYADLNYDCVVGLDDLAQLLGHYGLTQGASWHQGDIEPYPDGDGDVDLADLAELLGRWGPCGS